MLYLIYKFNLIIKMRTRINNCYIIAEAGLNHNGSMKIAKKLIDAAADAGADAVKFQTFKAKNLVTKKNQHKIQ